MCPGRHSPPRYLGEKFYHPSASVMITIFIHLGAIEKGKKRVFRWVVSYDRYYEPGFAVCALVLLARH